MEQGIRWIDCARALWRQTFTVLALVAAFIAPGPRANGQEARPNIILIVSDDAEHTGFGFTADLYDVPTTHETPNLDALAAQSVVASQGYVAASICGPSRAGLLTGQYQQRFGYEENLGQNGTAIQQ